MAQKNTHTQTEHLPDGRRLTDVFLTLLKKNEMKILFFIFRVQKSRRFVCVYSANDLLANEL